MQGCASARRLPHYLQGGELVVRHAGLEERFDYAADNADAICFVAFYAGATARLPGADGCMHACMQTDGVDAWMHA